MLSVDWDYFIPEKPEWDFGHNETILHLNVIWGSRMFLFDHMRTTGEEKTFWDRCGINADTPMFVSDSHCYVHDFLDDCDNVVLVDAHHDCWKADSLGSNEDSEYVYCHNWLRIWLKGKKNRKATWVCSDWAYDQFELPKDMTKRVKKVRELPVLKDLNVKRIHVCRSGCWTPPWLDKEFIEFVNCRGKPTAILQNDEWNPMCERWSDNDLKFYQEQERELREQMAKYRQIGGGMVEDK